MSRAYRWMLIATSAALVSALPLAGSFAADDGLERIRGAFRGALTALQGGASQRTDSLSGDFDRDGASDVAALVTVASAGKIPAEVTVLTPFSAGQAPPQKVSAGQSALAIVHSTGEAFLLVDVRPYSVLDTSAARALHVLTWPEVSALDEPGMAKARGDVIVLPSEAGIDTYLFWDGQSWRLYEPLELP